MATEKFKTEAPKKAAAPMVKDTEKKEMPEKDYGPDETMPAKAMAGSIPEATMARKSASLQRQMGNTRMGRMLMGVEEEMPTQQPLETAVEKPTEEPSGT